MSTERVVANHHLQDTDEFTVLSTGQPLAPDTMKELREAAAWMEEQCSEA